MKKFYFTYGSDGFAYHYGWTEVIADSRDKAIAAFNAYHPEKDGFIACSFIYSEKEFSETIMAKAPKAGRDICHETLVLARAGVN